MGYRSRQSLFFAILAWLPMLFRTRARLLLENLAVWFRHYHHERPHRGVGMKNEVPDKTFVPQPNGVVRCRQQLGGLIKSYYREAA